MKLAIVSEKTRYHFQKPLDYFKKVEISHLYKTTFSDSRLYSENLIEYKNIFDLYFKLKKIRPDLVQGLEPYYGYSRFKIPVKILPILFTTMTFCRLYRTPYFFHTLENISPERKYGPFFGKIMQYLAKIYAKNAAFIFYLNNGAKKNLLALDTDLKKISYALWGIWGVDIDEFKPMTNVQKRLIFIGTLNEQKGILDLLSAVSLAKKKIDDLKLVIIGTGSLYLKVEQTINNLGLSKSVTLVGEIPSEKISKYLADSYLLVAPSKELKYSAEQVGMVLLEAAACGVPVITNKTGSIKEFVMDQKTGLLIKANDITQLSDSIIRLWQSEKLHKKMAKSSREYALKKYNSKENTKLLEDLIIKKFNNND